MKIKNFLSLDNYNNNGFCIIRNFFKIKEINSINNELKKIERNISNFKIRKRDINLSNGIINSMHGLTKYSRFFKNISKNKNLIQACSVAMKKYPVFREAEFFAKPAKVGLPSPYHQDNYYWNIKNGNGLTAWISLNKTSKTNGTLKYLLGSHKIGVLKHVSSFAPGSSQKIPDKKITILKKKYKEISPRLKPGDIILHSSEIVHGSDANKSSNPRRGMTLQYQPKGSVIDKTGLKRYLTSLYKQIKIRKKIKTL
jgi:phytanoyl-CoA hydroxylase